MSVYILDLCESEFHPKYWIAILTSFEADYSNGLRQSMLSWKCRSHKQRGSKSYETAPEVILGCFLPEYHLKLASRRNYSTTHCRKSSLDMSVSSQYLHIFYQPYLRFSQKFKLKGELHYFFFFFWTDCDSVKSWTEKKNTIVLKFHTILLFFIDIFIKYIFSTNMHPV